MNLFSFPDYPAKQEVILNAEGHVVELSTDHYSTRGEIPAELGNLTSLRNHEGLARVKLVV